MKITESQDYNLLELHRKKGAKNITQFCNFINQLDVDELVGAYARLRLNAPRRKEYFVGHKGMPVSKQKPKSKPKPSEEHLAMALWNDFDEQGKVNHAEISSLRLLDYQFPLQSRRGDKGVGEVDLFAVMDDIYPCVIELKMDSDTSRGDSPLQALLQALAYCAIVEANMGDISSEAEGEFEAQQPRLMVMAPESYWEGYIREPRAGNWQPALQELARKITDRIGLQIYFVALHNCEFSMGHSQLKPRLSGPCSLQSALSG